jgi:hypothetical protein
MDAYVILKGGVFTKVEAFDFADESERDNYFTGETYRDIFNQNPATGLTGADAGDYYPATDGQAYNTAFGATQTLKARLSDEILHLPPRHMATRHTRLRFYKRGTSVVRAIFGPSNTILAPETALQPGDMVTFRRLDGDNQTPFGAAVLTGLDGVGGLVAGEIYVVRGSAGDAFSVSTTRGGVEVDITTPGGELWVETEALQYTEIEYLRCIADFKPAEWKAWSTSLPQRY